jgi:hypothetical protein
MPDGFETVYQAIKIVHPVKNDIWVVRWVTKEKENVKFFYTIHSQEKELTAKDLDEVNNSMKAGGFYDGRSIKLEDFEPEV